MDNPRSRIRVTEGDRRADGLRFCIVVSRFNSFITEQMLNGAVDTLVRAGASAQDIEIVRTPGAFEIPMVVDELLHRGGVDAVVALGCLIKGDTIHFDLIAAEACKGLASASLAHRVPVAFGVITTNTLEQAIDRAGAKAGNKGAEAADAAIEQARLYAAIREGGESGSPSKSQSKAKAKSKSKSKAPSKRKARGRKA